MISGNRKVMNNLERRRSRGLVYNSSANNGRSISYHVRNEENLDGYNRFGYICSRVFSILFLLLTISLVCYIILLVVDLVFFFDFSRNQDTFDYSSYRSHQQSSSYSSYSSYSHSNDQGKDYEKYSNYHHKYEEKSHEQSSEKEQKKYHENRDQSYSGNQNRNQRTHSGHSRDRSFDPLKYTLSVMEMSFYDFCYQCSLDQNYSQKFRKEAMVKFHPDHHPDDHDYYEQVFQIIAGGQKKLSKSCERCNIVF